MESTNLQHKEQSGQASVEEAPNSVDVEASCFGHDCSHALLTEESSLRADLP